MLPEANTLFFIRTSKIGPYARCSRNFLVLNLFLFFPDTVMIYNTRNRSNDTTESQKEKTPVLMQIFSTVSQKSRE